MANSKIETHAIRSKIFTVDATTSQNGVYGGERTLTDAEKEGAKEIIAQYARKSGQSIPLVCAYEGGKLRVQSPTSVQGVTVGVVLLY